MVSIRSALDSGTFSRSRFLVIGDTGVHLLMTGDIIFRHWGFVMTVLGSELLMFVLGWQSSFLLDRLDSVLMMMNFVLLDYILVDFLSFIWSDSLMRSFRFHLRVDGGIMMRSEEHTSE